MTFMRPRAAPPGEAPRAAPSTVATESCHLTLSSDPPEAEVEWAGKLVGKTPLLIDVLPGAQTFVLTHDGYLATTAVMNVEGGMAGRSDTRTIVLAPRANVVKAPLTTPAAETRKR